MPTLRALFLAFLVHSVAGPNLISAQRSKPPATSPWQTLNGSAPLVIAKGGFSGIFPDSSSSAYSLALMTSLPNLILWCDVQLTKDGVGICLPDVKLDNCTSIADYDKNGQKNYVVNGESTKGWFSVDYTLSDLTNVILVQNIWSRTNKFDGNLFPIVTVEEVGLQLKPPGLWLNIQHDAFFTQHNLSMRSYVISVSKRVIVSYVSSPEVGFLRSIVSRFRASTTKLVFHFLEQEKIEPSTNQTYGSLLKNLTFIKTFASGIMVPKDYIWPVNSAQYLEPHTFLVSDAHKEGLEVFASGFANDFTFSYNYTYDPVAEYLSFVDNGDFSVDGVLSDFPITPSEAIDCFSHIRKNVPGKAKPVVVSHNGASGVYPGSTDLAYNQAVEDGADYIDCSVQMTSDGIPICLDSVSLTEISNAIQSPFRNLSMIISDVQSKAGIFTFNLTWENIQSLKPAITNPPAVYTLFRNPAYKNAGSFQSLDQFLTFAKSKPIAGVVIGVENAAYLAEKKGLDIVGAVLDALNKAGYNNGTKQEVTIQSTNKAVLTKFKAQTTYKRMYMVDETIRGADDATLQDIKSFADSVAISKESVFPENNAFITGQTTVVQRLHLFKLPVYVYVFKNEFVYQAWDFFSDPIVEINTYATATGNEVDGIITDFPKTAVAYRKNKCLDMKDAPIYMSPVQPGSLMQVIPPQLLPPAEAPYPILVDRDVAESPLPPVVKQGPTTDGGSAVPPGSARPSGNQRITACGILSTVLMFLASVLIL